jgi:hypothetical protein
MGEAEDRERMRYLQLKAKATGSAPKSHSVAQSLGRGLVQGGTMGFIDELGGLAGKLFVGDGGVKLGANAAPMDSDTPEVRAAKLALKGEVASTPTGYALTRDLVRKDMDAARAANPGAFTTGEIGGAVASSFLPGLNVAKGASLSKTMGQMALQGGAMGLGDSEADLTKGELGRAAFDTTVGAALGAGSGALGHGIQKGVGWVAEKVIDKGDALLKKTLAKAREIGEKKAAEATAKARSEAGRAAQDTYKQLEHLRETGRMRALTPGESQVAQELTEELGKKAQGRLLPSAAEKQATSAAYSEAMTSEAARAAERTAEELAPRAGRDIGAIIKSYGEPIVGAAVGGWAGDALFDSPVTGAAALGMLTGRTRAGKMIADRVAKPGNQLSLAKTLRKLGAALGSGAEVVGKRGAAVGRSPGAISLAESGLLSIPQIAALFEEKPDSSAIAEVLRRGR